MALGDGSAWDETTPVDGTTIITGDDHIRDLRIGVRSGMAFEHEWPASQSATSERGKHKFVTMQNQSTKPAISGTQVAAIYVKTSALYFENSAGTEIVITDGTAVAGQKLIQVVSTSAYAVATLSGSMSHTAVPDITAGSSIFNLAITPTSTADKLHFEGVFMLAPTGNEKFCVAVFNNSNVCIGAVAAMQQAAPQAIPINFITAIATTAAQTYKVRAGRITAGTLYLNGDEGGTQLFTTTVGGTHLVIKQVKT